MEHSGHVGSHRPSRLRPGDLAAVSIGPGEIWRDIVTEVWAAGAALLPIDHRLPPAQIQLLLDAARPATLYVGTWWAQPDPLPVEAGDALVMATSGTAGTPKLAVLTHDAIRAAVATSAQRINATQNDAWLACLPFAHIGGLLVLLRALITGAPVTVAWPFDPASLGPPSLGTESVGSTGVQRFTSLVPTMLLRALDAGVRFDGYKAVLIGGAACPPALAQRAHDQGVPIVATYGLTESCGGVIYDGVPLDGTSIRVDADGIIELAGPTIMRGYLRSEREQPFTGDGWLRTGDAGILDDAGMLIGVERADDVIVTGGEKVHPTEVENVLADHPRVHDVAVVGTPDEEWGERVTAFIVPRGSMLTLDEARSFVAERLPRTNAPTIVREAPFIPRTPSGKIRRSLLRPRSSTGGNKTLPST